MKKKLLKGFKNSKECLYTHDQSIIELFSYQPSCFPAVVVPSVLGVFFTVVFECVGASFGKIFDKNLWYKMLNVLNINAQQRSKAKNDI